MRPRPTPALVAGERLFLEIIGDGPAPAAAAATPADWERAARLAVAHSLAEHLYARRAAAWWPACPEPVRAHLRGHYARTSLHNAALSAEMARLLAELRARDIAPLLLKGAALLATVHADPAVRPLGDVDLLVPRARVEETGAVLAARGYCLDESAGSAAFYRRHHYHLIWRHRDRPWLCVEVHWDVAAPLMDIGWGAADLWRDARAVVFVGAPALAPAPDQLLLHLSLHAAIGGFASLGQLRDAAALLAVDGQGLEPAPLWRRAREGRLSIPLQATLALTDRFWPGGPAGRLLAACPQSSPPLLLRLLRTESVLRRRTRLYVAGHAAVGCLRREGARERLAWLWRQFFPTPAVLGMESPGPRSRGRDIVNSLRHAVLPLKAAVYVAMTLAGWDLKEDRWRV